MKKAFITGINGQDGSNLSDYLLSLGYEVYGTIRRHSYSEGQAVRIESISDKVKTYYADLLDVGVLEKLLREIQPDEIYHLAAMSHVQVSFQTPSFTLQTNGMGTLNLLEAYRNNCSKAKFYMAASSECFGLSVDEDKMQRETTIMNPTSPYGCSKVLCYNLVRHYRRAYGLFAANGILFNHTGERRGSAFVEMKIVKAAVRIKLGLQEKLELGNLKACRDFGNSKDYVKAMHLILNHTEADDFVIASGETYSIEELCCMIFNLLKLNWEDYVDINKKYLRNEELPYLKGDSSKARNILGWKPQYTIIQTLQEMIDYWTNYYKK